MRRSLFIVCAVSIASISKAFLPDIRRSKQVLRSVRGGASTEDWINDGNDSSSTYSNAEKYRVESGDERAQEQWSKERITNTVSSDIESDEDLIPNSDIDEDTVDFDHDEIFDCVIASNGNDLHLTSFVEVEEENDIEAQANDFPDVQIDFDDDPLCDPDPSGDETLADVETAHESSVDGYHYLVGDIYNDDPVKLQSGEFSESDGATRDFTDQNGVYDDLHVDNRNINDLSGDESDITNPEDLYGLNVDDGESNAPSDFTNREELYDDLEIDDGESNDLSGDEVFYDLTNREGVYDRLVVDDEDSNDLSADEVSSDFTNRDGLYNVLDADNREKNNLSGDGVTGDFVNPGTLYDSLVVHDGEGDDLSEDEVSDQFANRDGLYNVLDADDGENDNLSKDGASARFTDRDELYDVPVVDDGESYVTRDLTNRNGLYDSLDVIDGENDDLHENKSPRDLANQNELHDSLDVYDVESYELSEAADTIDGYDLYSSPKNVQSIDDKTRSTYVSESYGNVVDTGDSDNEMERGENVEISDGLEFTGVSDVKDHHKQIDEIFDVGGIDEHRSRDRHAMLSFVDEEHRRLQHHPNSPEDAHVPRISSREGIGMSSNEYLNGDSLDKVCHSESSSSYNDNHAVTVEIDSQNDSLPIKKEFEEEMNEKYATSHDKTSLVDEKVDGLDFVELPEKGQGQGQGEHIHSHQTSSDLIFHDDAKGAIVGRSNNKMYRPDQGLYSDTLPWEGSIESKLVDGAAVTGEPVLDMKNENAVNQISCREALELLTENVQNQYAAEDPNEYRIIEIGQSDDIAKIHDDSNFNTDAMKLADIDLNMDSDEFEEEFRVDIEMDTDFYPTGSDSAAFVDRMDLADAYDDDDRDVEEIVGSPTRELAVLSEEDEISNASEEGLIEKRTVILGGEPKGDAQKNEEIDGALIDRMLRRKLGFSCNELNAMKPEVKAVVAKKRFRRPKNNLPPEFFHSGIIPTNTESSLLWTNVALIFEELKLRLSKMYPRPTKEKAVVKDRSIFQSIEKRGILPDKPAQKTEDNFDDLNRVLHRELGFSRNELNAMKPEVKAVVLKKRVKRPQNDLPPEFFNDGIVPTNLEKRKVGADLISILERLYLRLKLTKESAADKEDNNVQTDRKLRRLGYTSLEIQGMKPNIAYVLAEKNFKRPKNGMSPEFFVNGAIPLRQQRNLCCTKKELRLLCAVCLVSTLVAMAPHKQ